MICINIYFKVDILEESRGRLYYHVQMIKISNHSALILSLKHNIKIEIYFETYWKELKIFVFFFIYMYTYKYDYEFDVINYAHETVTSLLSNRNLIIFNRDLLGYSLLRFVCSLLPITSIFSWRVTIPKVLDF